MELTYRIIGADGREYGPITAAQFHAWAREGRAGGDTQVMRSDQAAWAAAASFPELGVAAVPGAPAAQPSAAVMDAALAQRIKSGASWFYWIGGVSLVNSGMALSGAGWRFIFGLGITQLFDELAGKSGGGGLAVAIVLDVIAAGLFILFGVFANKRHTWAFVVGMILFALDGLLSALLQQWLSVAFHVFALYFIFKGFQANRLGRAIQA